MSNKKTVDVKSCPFSHVEQDLKMAKIGDFYHVQCAVCGALSPMAETEDGAIAEWNTRDVIVISDSEYKRFIELQEGKKDGTDTN